MSSWLNVDLGVFRVTLQPAFSLLRLPVFFSPSVVMHFNFTRAHTLVDVRGDTSCCWKNNFRRFCTSSKTPFVW